MGEGEDSVPEGNDSGQKCAAVHGCVADCFARVCQEVEEDQACWINRLQKGCRILYKNPDGNDMELWRSKTHPV